MRATHPYDGTSFHGPLMDNGNGGGGEDPKDPDDGKDDDDDDG